MKIKRRSILTNLRRFSLLILIFVLYIVFRSIEPSFGSLSNLINILREASIQGILAIGLTYVVISGEIDLSFGANASLASVLAILFLTIGNKGLNLWIAWPLILVITSVVGLCNAFVVVKLKIPSLLGTIGTWLTIQGITILAVKGVTIWTSKFPPAFEIPGRLKLFGIIPFTILTLLVVAITSIIILQLTKVGRYFYAVGGNKSAATHVGILVNRIKTLAYVALGFLSGIAGITMASMFASSTPTVGQQFFFGSIIAVFLGSIFLKDGIPNITGTIVASLFLAIISNGFNFIGLQFWYVNIAQGILMIFSISMIQILSGKEIKGVKV
jgi:ribose transport system permease protein